MPQSFNKLLTVLLLLLIVTGNAFAQKLLTPSRQSSYYTYIYKLSDADVLKFYQTPDKPFAASALHTPVDSFKTDGHWENTLPAGNYVKAYAERNKLKYSLLENHTAYLKMFGNQYEHRFTITDKSGQYITGAAVTLNGQPVAFDEPSGTWHFKRGKQDNILRINYAGVSNFYSLASQNSYSYHQKSLVEKWWLAFKKIFRKRYNSYRPSPYTGFMVFNKPVYKPGDTVKFKAFLLNQRTKKPVSQKQLLVKINDSGEKTPLGTVTRYRPGGFDYSFVLIDSLDLTLDDDYQVELSDVSAKNKSKKGDEDDDDDSDEEENNKKILISGSFKYEEYELKSIKFALRADKKEHWPGNSLAVYMKATDENELPVADGRVTLTLITNQVTDYKTNHAYVPDTLWTHKLTLDAVGQTKALIPDSIFPKAGVTYDIRAQFLNANNEEQDKEVEATFVYQRFHILTDITNDTLKASYQEFGKPANAPAFISALNADGDTLSKTKVMLPAYVFINPNATDYNIATDSTDADIELREFESNVSLSGERTADSVFINVANPRKLPLFYSVFAGGKLIDGGKAVNVAYKRAHRGNQPVTFTVNYVWAGQVKKEEASVVFRKDVLHINVKQPVTVHPGQKITTDIVVTDAAGQPVANADVTAWAITKKFDYHLPYIPYLGRGYKGVKSKKTFNQKDIKVNGDINLDWKRWRSEMGLDSITYFQFTHPNSVYRIEEPASDTVTQIAPFVVKDGDILPVHILYIDERPVYFSQAQQLNPYSFKVSPGVHSLRFRLDTLTLKLDTVRVAKGRKLILGINADALIVKKVTDSLSIYEADLINKYLITVVNNLEQKKSLILQNDQTFLLNPYGTAGSTVLTGPLSNNYTIFDQPGRGQRFFTAEPGYSFLFEPGFLKQKSIATRYPFSRYLGKIPGATNYRQHVLTNRMADSIWQDYLDVRSYSQQLFTNPPVTGNNAGQLIYDRAMLKGERYTMIKNVILYRYDDLDYIRIYPGNTIKFGDLAAGRYRLFFLMKGDTYDIKENIEVRSRGINYYQFPVRPSHIKDKVSTAISGIIEKRNPEVYRNHDYQVENDALKLKEAFNDKYFDKGNFKQLITGRVIDKNDKLPIPGVTVKIKGTSVGTQTDVSGNFRLNSPNNAKLIISFIGYETKEVNAQVGKPLMITLVSSHNSLNEVVVVGYGVSTKRELTGAISSVSAQNLLQGRAAGIIVTEGTPGSSMSISIRGAASIGNQKPLYVVDGEIVEDLQGLSPDMIGEISVLKDAAGTALYGVKAANGVVIISTKGKTKDAASAVAVADTTGTQHAVTLRKNFADYAYWQPKLITDENGRASFTSLMPDDITNWRTFIIGITGKRQSGFSEKQIKSFKPLSANFIAPQFAVAGDEMSLIGKVMNYNATPVKVNRAFSYNGQVVTQGDLTISNAKIDTLNITATGQDSLEFEYSVKRDNGYFDGERRKIPVVKQGVQETKGTFAVLDNDTTITMKFDPAMGPVTFHAEASALPVLVEEAGKLRDYKYLCNEQLASKLKGLLSEKRIKTYLGEPFKYEKNIAEAIKKLMENRKVTGTWGWWKDTDEELWISLHAVEALLDAQQMGYSFVFNTQRLTDYLVYQLESYRGQDKLVCLQLLTKLTAKVDYGKYIAALERDYARNKEITNYDRFKLTLLKQQAGLKVKTDSLVKLSRRTIFGNMYWGEENYRFFDNSIQQTVLAYKILKNEGIQGNMLARIRGYFLEQRKNGEWRNTYESALILETILPDLLKKDKQVKPAALTVTGSARDTITHFPYTSTLKDNSIVINKTGGLPVYFTGYQQFWNSQPQKVSKDFTVNTWFERKGDKLTQLKGGESVQLKAEVTVKGDADFVMIGIPIPAGCSYESKDQPWDNNEVHREFLKEKVSIFCRKLKQGTYTFTVNLMPRYSGKYNLNPAKAEMMYFPVFYGREGMKKVVVGN